MRFLATAFAFSLLLMAHAGTGQNVDRGRQRPATPAPVKNILFAQPFTLETPYINTFSKEREKVSNGVLVVLEVDPALVVPRNSLEPVLYAGNVTVQRLNHGERSGRVIGIVPGTINLSTAPIWFGTPELPERVTKSTVQYERGLAEKAGVRAFPSTQLSSIQRSVVATRDLATLLRTVAADLIYQYSPQEKELADSWRLPEAKAAPTRQPN
jgi:hypothetical protein